MLDFVFIDSGTGGIPYLSYLKDVESGKECIYVADTINFPYGEKSRDEIIECVTKLILKIKEKYSPKAFVIACNTISVNALDSLRKTFPEDTFVGTVPAIKLAAKISKNRRIGLLATKSTCENPYNLELKEKFAKDCELVLRGDSELISFIEHKSFTASKEECINAVLPAVNFFKSKKCDVIILGCTHFLNLSELIQDVCGNDITVVDSREGVTNRALSLLEEDAKKTELKKECSTSKLFVTGFRQSVDQKEYEVLCKKFNMEFSGIL